MKNFTQIAKDALALKKINGVPSIGNEKGERKIMYVRANANGFGAGKRSIVDSETLKIVGVTNFENKNMLPKGKKQIVLGIRIAVAPALDAVVKTAKYGTDAGLPAFYNGELKIEQDGVLTALPIRDLIVTVGADQDILRSDQFFPVLPFELDDNNVFNIETETVGAIAVDHCFEIALDVIEVSVSSKTANQY